MKRKILILKRYTESYAVLLVTIFTLASCGGGGGGGGDGGTPPAAPSGSVLWSVATDPSAGADYSNAIAVDSTGLYVVGSDYSPDVSDSQWRIEKRSLTNGSLITSFGTGGVVTSNPGASYDAAYAVAVDSTGLYVVGMTSARATTGGGSRNSQNN